MRILMVQTFHFRRGGDSTYMLNLSGLLEENGHEVIPFAMKHPQNLESPYSEYFTSEIDFPGLLRDFSPGSAWTVLSRSIRNVEARRRIGELADLVRPDIAHFHNIHGHLTTSIIEPLRARKIPIVWTLHDFRQVCPNTSFLCGDEICERCLPNRFYNVLLHRCKKGSLAASFVAMLSMYYERITGVPGKIDRFIAPSGFLEGKLLEGGFDRGRIRVIPNFVDLEAYKPALGNVHAPDPSPGHEHPTGDAAPQGEAPLRGDESAFSGASASGEVPAGDYFVYFGRLLYEKGLDTLIRAVASLDRGELWLLGEGPVRDELESLVGESGTDRVKFKGHRGGEELRSIIARARFAVLPSRWYENLPFSIMEAFASGIPVIGSDIGGIPEMIDDGVNGYLFPLGDHEALADRIGRLLRDPDAAREMGNRGREKAERLYGRDRHYESIMQVYKEVLGGRAGE